MLTAKERVTLGKKAPCARPCASPIFAARAELEILLDELPELGETRVKASQSFGELSFWGALAGIIGAVAKHNAVLDIGVGTAAFRGWASRHPSVRRRLRGAAQGPYGSTLGSLQAR